MWSTSKETVKKDATTNLSMAEPSGLEQDEVTPVKSQKEETELTLGFIFMTCCGRKVIAIETKGVVATSADQNVNAERVAMEQSAPMMIVEVPIEDAQMMIDRMILQAPLLDVASTETLGGSSCS